jgi:hypothetical protein
MRIQEPGSRFSDRMIRRTVAETLGIPETESDRKGLSKTASTHTAGCDCCECPQDNCKCACKCPDHMAACAATCPDCSTAMQRIGEMDRCPCGYAQAATEKEPVKTVAKSAADASILSYYKQIYPDTYAKELTSDMPPKTPAAGKKVEYGMAKGTVKGASVVVTGIEVLVSGGSK